MAHPLRWRRLALDAWEIELRCPDCRQVWYERVPTAAVKRLDRVLKQARTELEKHLEEIDRIDFREQAEDFIAALQQRRDPAGGLPASPIAVGYVPAVEIDGRYRLEDRIG